MGRLIEVDTAIIAAVGYIEEWNGSPSMYHRRKITEKFMTLPTVDAVPVVRCKDCRFSDWYTAVDGKRYCYCMETGASGRNENDFCSYGVKDGDHHEG